jgi:hypothetical protein
VGHTFTSSLTAASVGTFSASYLLNFSDENIAGALNKSITLTLVGKTLLAGDYNGDSIVDAADYIVWRNSEGQTVAAYSGADGDGDGAIDDADYDVWRTNFGKTAVGSGALVGSSIPEPMTAIIIFPVAIAWVVRRGRRGDFQDRFLKSSRL